MRVLEVFSLFVIKSKGNKVSKFWLQLYQNQNPVMKFILTLVITASQDYSSLQRGEGQKHPFTKYHCYIGTF